MLNEHFLTKQKILSRMAQTGEFIEDLFLKSLKTFAIFVYSRNS